MWNEFNILSVIEKLDPGNLISPGDRVFYTYKRSPIIIGKRGGLNYPKKMDQVYPFDYIDDKFEIDYMSFITYVINTFDLVFSKLLDVKNKKQLMLRFIKFIVLLDKRIIII